MQKIENLRLSVEGLSQMLVEHALHALKMPNAQVVLEADQAWVGNSQDAIYQPVFSKAILSRSAGSEGVLQISSVVSLDEKDVKAVIEAYVRAKRPEAQNVQISFLCGMGYAHQHAPASPQLEAIEISLSF